MRIVYVTHSYFPFLCAGSTTSYYLLRELSREHEVVVISPNSSFPVEDEAPEDSPRAVRVPRVKLPYRVGQVTQFIYMREAVSAATRDADVTIIHNSVLRPNLPLARYSRCPVVAWTHDASPKPCSSSIVRLIERGAFELNRRSVKFVNAFTAPNECSKDLLRLLGVKEAVIIPNPVPTEDFYPSEEERERVREELGVEGPALMTVGFVSGAELLARMCNEIGIKLILVGKFKVKGAIVLEKVRNLRALYNASDCVIARVSYAPCYECSQPTKALEALATATPVLAHRGSCDSTLPLSFFSGRPPLEMIAALWKVGSLKRFQLREYVVRVHDSKKIAREMLRLVREVA
ncbi:MAG: glycosyltransferase family 4 protein [Candidatus Korarchaeum sp.]